jgi:peroxiredoxin
MFELQGLQLEQREFTQRNTEVVAIVVDPVEQNAHVVRDLGLDYRILADPSLTAIDAYGLRHDQGREQPPIARPATFLIDANGVVRWRDLTENYRLRPRPQTIVAAIDRITAAAP